MPRHLTGSAKAEAARGTAVMRMHGIDTIDLQILAALQADGRASNIKIATTANLTAPPTLRRTKTLEENGIIRGYYAVLDGRKLGYNVTAFLQVRLAAQGGTHIQKFEAAMRGFAPVRECYALSGHRDFLLKGVFRDLTASQYFVTDVLLKMDNVEAVTTSHCVHVTKDVPDVPLALVEAPPPPSAARKLRLPPLPRK